MKRQVKEINQREKKLKIRKSEKRQEIKISKKKEKKLKIRKKIGKKKQ